MRDGRCLRNGRLQAIRLFDDCPHRAGRHASGVGFVGIDVHGQGKPIADPYHDIPEGQAAAVAVDFHRHFVPVFQAESLGIGRSHVDVPFGRDNPLCQLDLPFGPTRRQAPLPSISPDSRMGAATPIARASVKDSSTCVALRTGPRILTPVNVFFGPTTSTRSLQANCPG